MDEECICCTAEKCRGAGFLFLTLANGDPAILCYSCVEKAMIRTLNTSNLNRVSIGSLIKKLVGIMIEVING